MTTRELLIIEPDQGWARAAARHTPNLVGRGCAHDPDLVIPSRRHFFPITGHARPRLLHVSDRSLSSVHESSQGPPEIPGDVQARKR